MFLLFIEASNSLTCKSCGKAPLPNCDGSGRVSGGLGAFFDFLPKAYKPCPQFEGTDLILYSCFIV